MAERQRACWNGKALLGHQEFTPGTVYDEGKRVERELKEIKYEIM